MSILGDSASQNQKKGEETCTTPTDDLWARGPGVHRNPTMIRSPVPTNNTLKELKARREGKASNDGKRVVVTVQLDGLNKLKTSNEIERKRIEYETRNSLLQTNGNEFVANAKATVQSLEVKDERMKKVVSFRTICTTPSSTTADITSKPVDGVLASCYSRYDQKHLDGDDDTEEFHIDEAFKTFGAIGLVDGVYKTLGRKPVPPPRKPIPKAATSSKPVAMKRKYASLTPIIIVPGIPPSLITILNAKDILEDQKFISHEEKKAGLTEFPKSMNRALIHKNIGSQEQCIPYKLVDVPEKLSASDWERVVGVFVIGKSWQFKGWPWKGSPVDICSKLCAFHLKFVDAELDANVKQWNVNVLQVSKTRRHLDKAAFQDFWKKLELHIAKNKPHLHY